MMEAMSVKMKKSRQKSAASLKKRMPTTAVPTAPMPVHTAYAVPTGSTSYDYVDVFVNPAFGGVTTTDTTARRPAGASWTVPATVTAKLAPAAGRVLLANVQVRTDSEVLVGSGDVVVTSVSP